MSCFGRAGVGKDGRVRVRLRRRWRLLTHPAMQAMQVNSSNQPPNFSNRPSLPNAQTGQEGRKEEEEEDEEERRRRRRRRRRGGGGSESAYSRTKASVSADEHDGEQDAEKVRARIFGVYIV
eukprot:749901-Hanusia_phi.AAC.5